MGLSCRRPGCGREAEVCITYDAVACQVWLDPIASAPTGGQPLCGDHARRLSAPRGWVVVDRRTSQAAIATPDPEPAPPRPARRRLQRAWGQFDAPRLEFSVDDEAPPLATPTVEPAPEAATAVLVAPPVVDESVAAESVAAEPVVDAPDAEPESAPRSTRRRPVDEERLLKPKGRLLSRAFEATGPQRSALTEPGPSTDDATR